MIYELTYGGYRLGTFPTEAAGFRCVRIRTECEVEHRTKGGDSRRHGMLVLDGDRVILEIIRSKNTFEGRRYRRASPPISRKDC